MLDMIRSLMAPKAAARLIVRTQVAPTSALALVGLVRSHGLVGWMQHVQNSHVLIEVEGAKFKIENIILRIQQTRLSNLPTVLEATWKRPTGQFHAFRASM